MKLFAPETGSATSDFIAQAYRRSWERYCESLVSAGPSQPRWDWIVLTAADGRQTCAFEAQIEWRRKAGLLPRRTRFCVVPDPGGRRVGSGGATLHALAELFRHNQSAGSRRASDPADFFRRNRVLLLHSGGESRRLPHCAALGKIFARVPRELPDGRPSTLFDEFLIALSGLPFCMHEGVFIASGDVLLLFDPAQLDLARQGIVGVAARAPAELGTRHGVYVAEAATGVVRRFLHKAPFDELRAAGALDAAGSVSIDTGMVWLDGTAAARLLELAGLSSGSAARSAHCASPPNNPFADLFRTDSRLNLYSDLLMPLAAETERAAYLADQSDGPPTPVVRRFRRTVWHALRGLPFHVQALSPVEFIHFGTTAEYVEVMTGGLTSRAPLGWKSPAAGFVADPESRDRAVIIGSCVEAICSDSMYSGVIEDCALGGTVRIGPKSLLSHVWSRCDLTVGAGIAVQQLPVAAPHRPKAAGFVTLVYGVNDNPKLSRQLPAATFCNRPWAQWLREAGVSPDDLWPKLRKNRKAGRATQSEQSLWTARLFPLAADRDGSLDLTLWMQNPTGRLDNQLRRRWRRARRFSMAEAARCAEVRGVLETLHHLADDVRVRQFCAAVGREMPSAQAVLPLGDQPAEVRRRAALAARCFEHASDPTLPIRGFKALADALRMFKGSRACLDAAQRYEDRAFHTVAALILSTARPRSCSDVAEKPARVQRRAVVEAPARIDFAGGWSDTPPFCIECGGTVLNAAVRLPRRLPVRVECEVVPSPTLTLESRDLGVSRTFHSAEPILRYDDPSDPLALHKAAAVLAGIVPRNCDGLRRLPPLDSSLSALFDGGLRIATEVALPQGSGLGTSSILAGALLACLRTLLDKPMDLEGILDEVLCLEQMLTTGGGWQDQVGGLTGGIKLATTAPGLPQHPRIEPVRLTADTAEALRNCLVVIYTGQRRLAKGILRNVMGRFMSRDPEVTAILKEIRDIAAAQRDALERGDLDAVGALLAHHWALNKRMDPGMSNPFIERLFEVCAPYSLGGKPAGAGGGGFLFLLARDGGAAARMAPILADTFPATGVGVWPFELSPEGLCFRQEK
ncbi:MAG: hypothetical protein N3D11_11175 [Candidatus Sumerlaeia bacterium]|nr:hypothetical protein [Candidatus Sumerlaeia bacterium]